MAEVDPEPTPAPTPEPPPTPPPAEIFLNKGAFPALFGLLNKLEAAIGLPRHFVENIATEDDWSFVIKLHALLEGALSMLLVERLSDTTNATQIREIVGRVPMSDRHTGKVEWALALGVLNPIDRQFVFLLSEFRNAMAHRIEMVGVTLAQYIASVDKNKRQNILTVLCPEIPQITQKVHERAIQEVLKNPKLTIWIRGFMLLVHIKMAIDTLAVKRGGQTPAQMVELAEQVHGIAQDTINLAKLLSEAVKTFNADIT